MKQCPVCGVEMPATAPYCPQCGHAMQLMKTLRMLTDNKGLDMLVGFAISFGLLFASGVVMSLLATAGITAAWLYFLPLIGTLLATLYAHRKFRYVAYGMWIPLIIVTLIVLGVLLLCSGFH